VVDLYHPAVFEKVSRDKWIKFYQDHSGEWKGTKHDVHIHDPEVKLTPERIFGVVPYTLTVVADEKPKVTKGFFLWISEDRGRNWRGLNEGMVTDPVIRKALPELPSDLKLPEKGNSQS